MKKKLLTALLAVIAVLTVPAAATDQETQIKMCVTEAIEEYAASIYRADAADEAFRDYMIHAFYRDGADMILEESDPMVSAMFNSCLMQEALINSISTGILRMQELGEESIYLGGGPSWHNFYDSYSYTGYRGTEKEYSNYFGSIVSTKTLYGDNHYTGPMNQNDETMHLLVGSLEGGMVLRRSQTREDAVVYDVELQLKDHFDFNGNYTAAAEKGFSTFQDELLKKIGRLLNSLGLENFYWEYTKTIQIEVPYTCDHTSGDYHWTYDYKTNTMTSDGENGYTVNNAACSEYVATTTGAVSYYFKLDEPVTLRHDEPWVVEYDTLGAKSFSLSPLHTSSTCYPYLRQIGRNYIWASFYERFKLSEEEQKATGTSSTMGYDVYYSAARMQDQYKYYSKHSYTYRLENVVAEDGNMVYVSIYDNDLGETVYGPAAMNDHGFKYMGDKTYTITDEKTDILSGTDIVINYIGNKSYRLPAADLDLRIYTRGEDAADHSAMKTEYASADCTTPGRTIHTCTDCGYTYAAIETNPTGHSYGAYTYDNNATCVADGTKSAVCATCGYKDTVPAEGTGGSGHSYADVLTEPTCTVNGYTTHTCLNCGESYQDSVVPAAGHSEVTDRAVSATCTRNGRTKGSHCEVCGEVLVEQESIPSNGHDWDEGAVTLDPTTGKAGVMTYTCFDCGATREKRIDPLPDTGFEDVLPGAYYEEAVSWAGAEGITSGVSEELFAPDLGCTRAQVVTFLWRCAGSPAPKTGETPFADVAEGSYYYDAVLWAVEEGVTRGVSDTAFAPDEVCTRAQVVTFLWRNAGSPAVKAEDPFADVAAGSYYYDAVLWAVERGITSGVSPEFFAPGGECARAHIVTFLHRANAAA